MRLILRCYFSGRICFFCWIWVVFEVGVLFWMLVVLIVILWCGGVDRVWIVFMWIIVKGGDLGFELRVLLLLRICVLSLFWFFWLSGIFVLDMRGWLGKILVSVYFCFCLWDLSFFLGGLWKYFILFYILICFYFRICFFGVI